jgi:hypothetical protein
MSFKRISPEDFVVSSDSISATLWSGATPTLNTFFTSSTQEASSGGKFYLNVYQTASLNTNAAVQFAIAYGHKNGSGSVLFNPLVAENSPTKAIYGQYQNLILGDENNRFSFGGTQATEFWALSIDRNRYKEKLFLGSLELKLSGSTGVITLTEDSKTATSVTFNEAGRVFQIVSGSQGVVYTGLNANGYSVNNGSYGIFLPDIGTILLHPLALSESIGLLPSYSVNSLGNNNQRLYRAISGSTAASFKLNSEETITSNYIFVRVKNADFNYSENPSYISGSTGELTHNLFINNPQTYITAVGLYNDNNDLLATAKLSRPLPKNFTKESLIRLKLDF